MASKKTEKKKNDGTNAKKKKKSNGKAVTNFTVKKLADEVCANYDIPKAKAIELIQFILEKMENKLYEGEQVYLAGFGRFFLSERKERQSRNPKTGEKINVPAHKVLKFKPTKKIKDAVRDLN